MSRSNYLIISGPESNTPLEFDMATCGHCQKQMAIKPPKTDSRIVVVSDGCFVCKAALCNICKSDALMTGCVPWQKRRDEEEKNAYINKRLKEELMARNFKVTVKQGEAEHVEMVTTDGDADAAVKHVRTMLVNQSPTVVGSSPALVVPGGNKSELPQIVSCEEV